MMMIIHSGESNDINLQNSNEILFFNERVSRFSRSRSRESPPVPPKSVAYQLSTAHSQSEGGRDGGNNVRVNAKQKSKGATLNPFFCAMSADDDYLVADLHKLDFGR